MVAQISNSTVLPLYLIEQIEWTLALDQIWSGTSPYKLSISDYAISDITSNSMKLSLPFDANKCIYVYFDENRTSIRGMIVTR